MILLPVLVVTHLLCESNALNFPTIYGSNMVLQENATSVIWGVGNAGAAISMTSNRLPSPLHTKADGNGKFAFTWPAIVGIGAAFSIEIEEEGGGRVVWDNVVLGDVFLCFGQSNMEIQVDWARNATSEIAAADFPSIRILQVAMADGNSNASSPQTNTTVSIPWSTVQPSTIPTFSAYCYYFGRDLHFVTNRPVGLLQSSWGGTSINVWGGPIAHSHCPSKSFASGSSGEVGRNKDIGEREVVEVGRNTPHIPHTLPPFAPKAFPVAPSCLFYSMIAPLTPLALRGAIYDQGEADAANPAWWACMMAAMSEEYRTDWAGAFGGDRLFPVVFRQLHAYPWGGILGEMRMTQPSALEKAPNLQYVTSYDLSSMNGTVGNIHFLLKQEIGRRGALAIRSMSYDSSVQFKGPELSAVHIHPPPKSPLLFFSADLSFENVDENNPIKIASPLPPYHGIELLSASMGNYPADGYGSWVAPVATVLSPNQIRLNFTFDTTTTPPTKVRYGFVDFPVLGITDTTNNLPARPFLVDL